MTANAEPSTAHLVATESPVKRFFRATEIDTPAARHGRRAGADLGRLPDLRPDHHRRRRVPHAAQSVEPAGPDLGHRGDEHRHGAHHRHAPHRPLGRLDAELHRRRHRRRAGLLAGAVARLRQSGDLDHRRRHRARNGRAARRLQRLPRRLRRHSLLHRHARRPHRLQRRRLVGDPRRDRRADGFQFRADRRHAAGGVDRRHGELGSGRRSSASRSSPASSLNRSARARFKFPQRPIWAEAFLIVRRLRGDARNGRRRQRLSLAAEGRRGLRRRSQHPRAAGGGLFLPARLRLFRC